MKSYCYVYGAKVFQNRVRVNTRFVVNLRNPKICVLRSPTNSTSGEKSGSSCKHMRPLWGLGFIGHQFTGLVPCANVCRPRWGLFTEPGTWVDTRICVLHSSRNATLVECGIAALSSGRNAMWVESRMKMSSRSGRNTMWVNSHIGMTATPSEFSSSPNLERLMTIMYFYSLLLKPPGYILIVRVP